MIPAFLLNSIDEVWIIPGDNYWGKGLKQNHILIHSGSIASDYDNNGNNQVILVHKACHAVLDETMYTIPAWSNAAQEDGGLVLEYNKSNPIWEDTVDTISISIFTF